jgi:hypothetical protein
VHLGQVKLNKVNKTHGSMHLGLLILGQCKHEQVKKGNEEQAPGATAPGAVQMNASKEIRSMHRGLLHPGQLEQKRATKKHEKHAHGATVPGANQAKGRKEWKREACTEGCCTLGNSSKKGRTTT